MKKGKSVSRRLFHLAIFLILLVCIYAFLVNAYVIGASEEQIASFEQVAHMEADAVLLLGCGVNKDGSLSPMLKDRCITAAEIYKNHGAKKIIASGDNGTNGYDEVNPMKDYLLSLGVPGEDIFMDHAGFCTYDSVYRAKAIFGCSKVVVVTQRYHLFRALYICEKLGLSSMGSPADSLVYRGQIFREIREILARNKDFLLCMIKPLPTYMGEKFFISGDGRATWDK